jgi:hypothetical protein
MSIDEKTAKEIFEFFARKTTQFLTQGHNLENSIKEKLPNYYLIESINKKQDCVEISICNYDESNKLNSRFIIHCTQIKEYFLVGGLVINYAPLKLYEMPSYKLY